jgi:hypothetical protein
MRRLLAILALLAFAAAALPAHALMCSWGSHRPECGYPRYCAWYQRGDGSWYQVCG